MEIRHATLQDTTGIYELGRSDSAFAVSRSIPFYELSELEQWVQSPKDNLLMVASIDCRVVGFLFCKVISHHWAMLDNCYVHPQFREQGIGSRLLGALIQALKERGIEYMSALCNVNDRPLLDHLSRKGFQLGNAYRWIELFVDGRNPGDSNRTRVAPG
jgi:GNAT superfamily N-acetyltransferase